MDTRRCKCGAIINADDRDECLVCLAPISESTVAPSTSKNIEEAKFYDFIEEMADENLKHPEEYQF